MTSVYYLQAHIAVVGVCDGRRLRQDKMIIRPHPLDVFSFARSLLFFTSGEAIVKALVVALLAGVTYVFPDKSLRDAALAAAVLVILDTTTGIMAAFVEKQRRSSVAFARVLSKCFAYLSVCIVAAVVERTIFSGMGLSLTLGVLWLIIATEGLSILENVERTGGGRWRALRSLLGRMTEHGEGARSRGHRIGPKGKC